MKLASCHPTRRVFAKGLCKWCYEKDLRSRNPNWAAKQKRLARQWVIKNKQKLADRAKNRYFSARLQREFGITEATYTHLLELQGGRCAICRTLPKRRRLDVDHNHRTGMVRGLLCEHCNRGLGLFNDDFDRLIHAAEYLTKPCVVEGRLFKA